MFGLKSKAEKPSLQVTGAQLGVGFSTGFVSISATFDFARAERTHLADPGEVTWNSLQFLPLLIFDTVHRRAMIANMSGALPFLCGYFPFRHYLRMQLSEKVKTRIEKGEGGQLIEQALGRRDTGRLTAREEVIHHNKAGLDNGRNFIVPEETELILDFQRLDLWYKHMLEACSTVTFPMHGDVVKEVWHAERCTPDIQIKHLENVSLPSDPSINCWMKFFQGKMISLVMPGALSTNKDYIEGTVIITNKIMCLMDPGTKSATSVEGTYIRMMGKLITQTSHRPGLYHYDRQKQRAVGVDWSRVPVFTLQDDMREFMIGGSSQQ